MTHLEFCAQALWPELDVRLASVDRPMGADGHRRAEVAHDPAGDRRRRHFATLPSPSSQRSEVSLFGGRLQGRLFRISFSGELAYELAVPAGYGESVADALMEAGERTRHRALWRRGARRHAHRKGPCHA